MYPVPGAVGHPMAGLMQQQNLTPQFMPMSKPYIEFQRRVVERQHPADHPTLAGSIYAVDVDFVIVTPQGSKDRFEKVAEEWFKSLKNRVDMGLENLQVYITYQQQYEFWKQGKEVPLEGTPIADWPLATGEQRRACIACNVRTVEDLAHCNQETIMRIGMGGQQLRNRANDFLTAKNDTGPLVMKVQSQEIVIEELRRVLKEQADELRALKTLVGVEKVQPNQQAVAQRSGFAVEPPEEADPDLVGEALNNTIKEI